MLVDMTDASWSAPAGGRPVPEAINGTAIAAELLRRSGAGDEAAFAELYDLTCLRLFGLVLRVVRDPALCEQVTGEVYLHVWRHSARFDPSRGSALAWIMTIAHRSAADRVR
jgi:RNA polymerase sigma-70 factor (ECF subfamily)